MWQWGGWQQAGTDDLYLPGQQPPCQQIISGKSNSITGPRLPKRAAESKAEPQPTSLNKLFPIAWKSHTWNISITSTKVKLGGFLIVCFRHLMSQNTPLRKRCLLHPDPVSPRLTYIQARRKGSSLNYILADPSATFIGPLCLKSLKLRPKIIVSVIYWSILSAKIYLVGGSLGSFDRRVAKWPDLREVPARPDWRVHLGDFFPCWPTDKAIPGIRIEPESANIHPWGKDVHPGPALEILDQSEQSEAMRTKPTRRKLNERSHSYLGLR